MAGGSLCTMALRKQSQDDMAGGRSIAPETGGLDADGLIPLDLSGLYI